MQRGISFAMFRSSWVITIAFGLILAFSEAKAQDSVPPSADSPTIETGDKENIADDNAKSNVISKYSITVRVRRDAEEAKRTEARESISDAREQRDLAAQESMAESTDLIVTISWWQLLLAAVGTFTAILGTGGLIYSLFLNRAATRAAVKAADAAKEVIGNDRAWLVHSGQTAGVANDSYLDGIFYERLFVFTLRFENVGRSPAIKATAVMDYAVSDAPEARPEIVFSAADEDHRIGTIGQGVGISTTSHAIQWDMVEKVILGEKYLFIHAIAEYEDIFHSGVVRITEGYWRGELRREVDVDGNAGVNLILGPIGQQNRVT